MGGYVFTRSGVAWCEDRVHTMCGLAAQLYKSLAEMAAYQASR